MHLTLQGLGFLRDSQVGGGVESPPPRRKIRKKHARGTTLCRIVGYLKNFRKKEKFHLWRHIYADVSIFRKWSLLIGRKFKWAEIARNWNLKSAEGSLECPDAQHSNGISYSYLKIVLKKIFFLVTWPRDDDDVIVGHVTKIFKKKNSKFYQINFRKCRKA